MKYLFLIVSILVIGMNLAATALPLNGLTTAYLSNIQKTTITPAGSTFIIWSIIFGIWLYLGVGGIIGKVRISQSLLNVYIASALVNVGWLFAWHYQVKILPAILLTSLMVLNLIIARKFEGLSRHLYLVYTSWTIVASVINLTILFQYDLGLSKTIPIAENLIGVILLIVGSVLFALTSRSYQSATPLLVGTWAYFGIYREQTKYSDVQTTAVILALMMIFMLVLKLINSKKNKLA
ncbi:MAG: hypothetical protein ACRCXZ_02305 [Patescibacteria group bacterium]